MKSEAEVGKPELSLVSESRDFSLAAILFTSFDASVRHNNTGQTGQSSILFYSIIYCLVITIQFLIMICYKLFHYLNNSTIPMHPNQPDNQ